MRKVWGILAATTAIASSCVNSPPNEPPVDGGAHDAGRDAGAARDAGRDGGERVILGGGPFGLEPAPGDLVARPGDVVTLRVGVPRERGYPAVIEVATFGLPRGSQCAVELARERDEYVTLEIHLDDTVELGPHPFALQASADGWHRNARIVLLVQ